MILFPNAKINLGLFVTEKRSDGFHNIETIFYPIPLCDALEITVGARHISTEFILSEVEGLNDHASPLQVHGIQIDGNPTDNLVYKAYNLLKSDFDLPDVRIDLLKKIPFGAGLGGGSSDAAFMLKLLNQKFSLNLSDENLEDYARRIGSDCAFFVKNKPVFAYEKGDKFEPIELDLSGYQLVLVCPPIHVCTKTAYQNIVPRQPLARTCSPCQPYFNLRNLPELLINEWKNVLQNDFEPYVFATHPILSDIKQKLYDAGAVYASMSGSGSAMFGLFPARAMHALPLQNDTFDNCKVFCLNLQTF